MPEGRALQSYSLPEHDGRIHGAQGDLDSFLIEISSLILPKKDDKGDGYLVDKILDKTGMKGTGELLQSTQWVVAQMSLALCQDLARLSAVLADLTLGIITRSLFELCCGSLWV